VLGDVTEDMGVNRQETFGPIVGIVPFDDSANLERALRRGPDKRGETRHRLASWRHRPVRHRHDCSALALNDYLVVKRITRALDTA
jgi:succinate-semialdehyde dehydrogenase/glutarate-semialdehyde dehydrogenase